MVVALIGLRLWESGEYVMAFIVPLLFHLYLRPGEIFKVRAKVVVSPVQGSMYNMYSLNLHPQEAGIASKVCEFDETAVIDQEQFQVLGVARRRLKRYKRPEDLLVDCSQAEFSKDFVAAARLEGLSVLASHTYQLRHSGPSHDRALKLRSMTEIKLRCTWKSATSLRRYQKEGRVSGQMAKLAPEMRRRALAAPRALLSHLASLSEPFCRAPRGAGGRCTASSASPMVEALRAARSKREDTKSSIGTSTAAATGTSARRPRGGSSAAGWRQATSQPSSSTAPSPSKRRRTKTSGR